MMFSIPEETRKRDYPYFQARHAGKEYVVSGTSHCELGHRVAAPPGERPDGTWAEWYWDGQTLSVANDRFGSYGLFYYCRDGEIAVSPSLIRLVELGAPTELDEPALAVFYRLGYFLGEDTPFRQIRAVPPNAEFGWTEGRLTLRGERPEYEARTMSRDEAIDGFIQTFRGAIERRLPEGPDFAVPLSGGRDSRQVLLELCHLGYRPKYCVTTSRWPPRLWLDLHQAKQLAAELGLRHVKVGLAPRLRAELRNIIEMHFCADEGASFHNVADYLKSTVRTCFSGIGGDVVLGREVGAEQDLELYRKHEFGQLAERWLGPPRAAMEQVFPLGSRAGMTYEAAHARLVEEFTRYADAPSPLRMFKFWNQLRREWLLMPVGLLWQLEAAYCPYVDSEVVAFLASIPDEMMLRGGFHEEAIRRAHPAYAHIPFSMQRPQGMGLLHFARYCSAFCVLSLTTRPGWLTRNRRLFWRWLRCLTDPEYREANRRWLSPTRLIHALLLEQLCDES